MTRRELKKEAKHIVRKNYAILLVVCVTAAFMGTEFGGSLDFIKQARPDDSPEIQQLQEAENVVTSGATEGIYNDTTMDVIFTALSGEIGQSREMSKKLKDEAVARTKNGEGNSVLGRSRGLLAKAANNIMSGAIFVKTISAAEKIGMSTSAIMAVFIILALLVFLSFWFFLVNMYTAVSRRIFLECRIYERVTIQRFLVFIHVRKWCKVACAMFMTTLLHVLWSFTIAGYFIKRYSYFLVPYILAENPDAGWKEAISLSRKIMQGHKWECFILEASFFWWYMLGMITFGLSDLFFTNMYKTAALTGYYAELRQQTIERQTSGFEILNDRYLYVKADRQLLESRYPEAAEMERLPEPDIHYKGIAGFLANVLGITVINRRDEAEYEAYEAKQLQLRNMEAIVDGLSYPGRLSAIPEHSKNKRVAHIRYMRHYSIPSLIMLFFIFSFIGWLWEVSLHLILDGVFVNRGVMYGPWLPIYGAGGILILTLLSRFRSNPAACFIAIEILCGFVEYFTSYYLESTYGQKWWDYSGYFLNLNGRICAEGLITFAIGGMAIVYLLAPLIDNHLRKINYKIAIPVCVFLLGVFMADHFYSAAHPNEGKGVTDYSGASIQYLSIEDTCCLNTSQERTSEKCWQYC